MDRANTAAYADMINALTACSECDLLIKLGIVSAGHNANCPRCGAILFQKKTHSALKILALSLTGLLLYVPANFLPLMTLEMMGKSNANTIFKGVVHLFNGGYWWMSGLVFFCSMLAPLILLLLLSMISVLFEYNNKSALLPFCVKSYHALHEWGMLDVFMLGILVAFIKMMDYGYLVSGIGLYCYIGLLVVTTWTSVTFDDHLIWQKIEENQYL